MQSFAKRLLLALVVINLVFVALYFSPAADTPNTRFNMDGEIGVPAWFTQILLYTAAGLATLTGYLRRKDPTKQPLAWYGMGAILLYLSIDEGAAIHELLAQPVREALSINQGPWIFAWTIPAIAVVMVICVLFTRFYFHLPLRTRFLLAASAALYVGGALGMEVVSGFYWSENDFVFDKFYRVLTAIEESFENFGVILTIYTLVDYLAIHKLTLRIK